MHLLGDELDHHPREAPIAAGCGRTNEAHAQLGGLLRGLVVQVPDHFEVIGDEPDRADRHRADALAVQLLDVVDHVRLQPRHLRRPWVWPGGHIVITYRPCRHQGRLVELPAAIHEAAHAIGLIPADNCTTLTAPLRNDRDRLRNVRCAGAHPENTGIHGNMTAALADLNVLVFRLPTSTSRETTLQRGAL